jgi:hypothetical protein
MGALRQPLTTADPADAGGAYVRRAFDFGKRRVVAGDKLSKQDLEGIPTANLTALVNTGLIQLWPESPSDMFIAERFVIPAAGGKFDVVEGRKVTKGPVSKRHALKLAKG